MRRSAPAAVVLLWLAAGLCAPVGAQDAETSWIDFARLEDGQVQLKSQGESRGTVTIDLAIEIHADWQAIWKILTACEISPEYVPHVLACSRIATSDADNSELFMQTVKPAFFLPKFDHVFRLEYSPPDRIEVSHVSGPIDRMDGHWLLLPQPNGTIALVHRMTVKPGFPVPRMFVRNTLEDELPEVLREIRRRAESTDD